MAKKTFPSDQQDQFMIRMPNGLRERIKKTADANKRSMNAEVVATLEEAYPAPREFPFLDIEMLVLQWNSDNWFYVDWDTWTRFRSGDTSTKITDSRVDGTNYFVVVVFDKMGTLCNLISHGYEITETGYRNVSFDLLNEDEKNDYSRLMVSSTLTKSDEERLRAIRDKMVPSLVLPSESIPKIKEILNKLAPSDLVESLLLRAGMLG